MRGGRTKKRSNVWASWRLKLFANIVVFGLWQAQASMAGQTLYSYDSLGRLTQAVSDNGSVENYHYDSAGNRIQTDTQNVIKYLHLGESFRSANGHTCLIMQGDGNLVVYGDRAYWNSATPGNPGSSLSVTDDGAATITSAKGRLGLGGSPRAPYSDSAEHSLEIEIFHEGIHGSNPEYHLPSAPMIGEDPWQGTHQKPYNNAASQLLGLPCTNGC